MEEYVDGYTLTDFLQSNADYFHDPVNSDKFARQLLAVLHYLHQHQVLFLDLKPDNILITRIGHDVRLVDLGFAFVSGYPETAGLTPSFAAPEQRDKQEVDERTDIWLYGRILQYVGVSPIYNKVVEHCMEEHPGDRYDDMEQLQHSLPPSPRSRRRRKLVIALSLRKNHYLCSCFVAASQEKMNREGDFDKVFRLFYEPMYFFARHFVDQTTDIIKTDTLTYTRWLQGEFYYHDAPLYSVIEDLCRYYDCQPADFVCDTPHDHFVSLQANRLLSLRQVLALLNKSNGGVNIRLK